MKKIIAFFLCLNLLVNSFLPVVVYAQVFDPGGGEGGDSEEEVITPPVCTDVYRYNECNWDTNQVYEVYQNTCTDEYDRRNYQYQEGQCGYSAQPQPTVEPAITQASPIPQESEDYCQLNPDDQTCPGRAPSPAANNCLYDSARNCYDSDTPSCIAASNEAQIPLCSALIAPEPTPEITQELTPTPEFSVSEQQTPIITDETAQGAAMQVYYDSAQAEQARAELAEAQARAEANGGAGNISQTPDYLALAAAGAWDNLADEAKKIANFYATPAPIYDFEAELAKAEKLVKEERDRRIQAIEQSVMDPEVKVEALKSLGVVPPGTSPDQTLTAVNQNLPTGSFQFQGADLSNWTLAMPPQCQKRPLPIECQINPLTGQSLKSNDELVTYLAKDPSERAKELVKKITSGQQLSELEQIEANILTLGSYSSYDLGKRVYDSITQDTARASDLRKQAGWDNALPPQVIKDSLLTLSDEEFESLLEQIRSGQIPQIERDGLLVQIPLDVYGLARTDPDRLKAQRNYLLFEKEALKRVQDNSQELSINMALALAGAGEVKVLEGVAGKELAAGAKTAVSKGRKTTGLLEDVDVLGDNRGVWGPPQGVEATCAGICEIIDDVWYKIKGLTGQQDRGYVSTGARSIADPAHGGVNQDAVICNPASGVCAVFDGMGGTKGGEIASSIASNRFQQALDGLSPNVSEGEIRDALNRAYRTAQNDMLRAAMADPSLENMGTTATVAKVFTDPTTGQRKLITFQLGDSLSFLQRPDGGVQALTQIQGPTGGVQALTQIQGPTGGVLNSAQARVLSEARTAAEAERMLPGEGGVLFANRNMISGSIGPRSSANQPIITTINLDSSFDGSRLIVASDGVGDNLRGSEIVSNLRDSRNPDQAARKLVTSAKKVSEGPKRLPDGTLTRAKHDDISVSIIEIPPSQPSQPQQRLVNGQWAANVPPSVPAPIRVPVAQPQVSAPVNLPILNRNAEIFVKRSNGTIEGGWRLLLNNGDGTAKVRKGNLEGNLIKTVKIQEIEQLNNGKVYTPAKGSFNIFDLLFINKLVNLFKADTVFAHEGFDRLMTQDEFQLFSTKTDVKNRLIENGQISSEEIKQLLIENSEIPAQGLKDDNRIVVTTGDDGQVEFEADPGTYKINSLPIKGVDLFLPATIVVNNSDQTIGIGINKGSGQVKTSGQLTNNSQEQKTAKVKIVTFYDKNSNGMFDSDEKVIPWAGAVVSLTKVLQDTSISLKAGWNLISLTALPNKALTASTLLKEVNNQIGNATTVSTLIDGAWKSYVVRGNSDYSMDDFPIEIGKSYFVKALKPSTFTYSGQNLVAPVKVKVQPGWNTVGFPFLSKAYQASGLVKQINADTVSRWESGLWDSFMIKNAQKYGEDFNIESNKGYILKVNQEGELIP